MNIIFIDFDGVLCTLHDEKLREEELYKNVERRVAILGEICKAYDAKVVIESASKIVIDEETMEIDEEATWIRKIFELFKKYDVDCIGRTPEVPRRINEFTEFPIWKEDEIRLFLYRHPEIDHYCVIDDDDLKDTTHGNISDLNKVRNHLVVVKNFYPQNIEETGLLEKHKEEVGLALQEENEIKRLIIRRDRIKGKHE